LRSTLVRSETRSEATWCLTFPSANCKIRHKCRIRECARLTPLAGFFAFSEQLSSRRKPEAPPLPVSTRGRWWIWRPSETIGRITLPDPRPLFSGLACLRPLWGSRTAQPVPSPNPHSGQLAWVGPRPFAWSLRPSRSGCVVAAHQLPSGKGGVSPNRFADTLILGDLPPAACVPSHPPSLRPTDVCLHNCRARLQRAVRLIAVEKRTL
jgi:hypothetical protein